MRMKSLSLIALLCGLATFRATAAEAEIDFFERRIRPLLVENCYKCHSAEAEKLKGGLLLDTKEELARGGDTDPAVVRGDPDASPRIRAVRWSDEKLQMPAKKKLTSSEIADLEAWVKMGAPDPRTTAASI